MVRRERVLFPIFTTGVILVVWMATLFIVIIFSPDVYQHLYNYIHGQLIGGLLHVQTVGSRFYILYVLLVQGVIPLLVIVLLCLIRIKRRPFYRYMLHWRYKNTLTAEQIQRAKLGWFFLVMGLSGILPIMLGLKQQEFYVVPTLPFFAIAMACLLYDLLEDWLLMMNRTAKYVLTGLAVLLFGTGIILNINSINKINTNSDLLGDMQIILPYIDYGETVSVKQNVLDQPEVAEYFYRYKKILFDTGTEPRYLLTIYDKVDCNNSDVCYEDMHLPTRMYHLHKKMVDAEISDEIDSAYFTIDTITFVEQ